MIHKYEDTTADARDKLYHVLQELYQENFETVKKFSCLKNCLKIFVDRQTNAKEAADARKSLLIFFRSDIPVCGSTGNDKKTFLDTMEDSWKNNSYTTVQKERILELIKDGSVCTH